MNDLTHILFPFDSETVLPQAGLELTVGSTPMLAHCFWSSSRPGCSAQFLPTALACSFFSWSRVTFPRYPVSQVTTYTQRPAFSQLSSSSLTAFPQFTSASNALWLTGILSYATRVAKELCMQIPGKHDDQHLFLQLTHEGVFNVNHLTFFLSLVVLRIDPGPCTN